MPASRNCSLSVIVPTYCERDNMAPLLARIGAVAAKCSDRVEVLIADGASDDGTAEAAEAGLLLGVQGRVIRCAPGTSLVDSVMSGVREARGELIAVMDADLSHPPELLPTLCDRLCEGYDVVVASRYVRGGGTIGWSWHRAALSWLGNCFARPLTRVADATSGFFVARAACVQALEARDQGFKILLELLASRRDARVCEVGYQFRDRVYGRSKLTLHVMWRYARQLARLYRQAIWPRLAGKRNSPAPRALDAAQRAADHVTIGNK